MDAAESGGPSPPEPLSLKRLQQARRLLLQTLLLNRSLPTEIHTHVLFHAVSKGGVDELTGMLMLARLWRFLRVGHGIVMATMKADTDQDKSSEEEDLRERLDCDRSHGRR